MTKYIKQQQHQKTGNMQIASSTNYSTYIQDNDNFIVTRNVLRPQQQHIGKSARFFLYAFRNASLQRFSAQDGHLGVTLSHEFLHHPIRRSIPPTASSSLLAVSMLWFDLDHGTVGARIPQGFYNAIGLGFPIETKGRTLQDHNGQQQRIVGRLRLLLFVEQLRVEALEQKTARGF